NVVAGSVGVPHAVLIRAVEPVEGLHLMQENRGLHPKQIDWTNGPGKLTKALGITMDYYGHDWQLPPLFIGKGASPKKIETSPRIGIENANEAVDYPWRFYEKDNPTYQNTVNSRMFKISYKWYIYHIKIFIGGD